MSILTEKLCRCGKKFLSAKYEARCDRCLKGDIKNVLCVYCGMVISFRMPEDAVQAFTEVLHDNGALMIEVLPFD